VRPRRIELALIAAALLAFLPAQAQQRQPTELEEMLGHPKRAPVVPPELRPMVRESRPERLIVRGLGGGDIAVDISQREPVTFGQYGGGRFLGFSFMGYEFFGHTLVDRRMSGEAAVVETGAPPVFSPDGRHFVALQISESAFGNFEGLGLWEVRPDGIAQLFFTDALPHAMDWRVDGWASEECAALSAVAFGWQPPQGEDWETALPRAPRTNYNLQVGPPIMLQASDGCSGVPAATEGGSDG